MAEIKDRIMATYQVGVRWEQERIQIEAKNSTDAKRKFCRLKGRSYNDPWCGGTVLTAELMKFSEPNLIQTQLG